MKKTSKEIIKKIKDKEKVLTKSNFTFRLNADLMAKLKYKCEANGISMASVIEELIREFTIG